MSLVAWDPCWYRARMEDKLTALDALPVALFMAAYGIASNLSMALIHREKKKANL